jgi:predicted ATPase
MRTRLAQLQHGLADYRATGAKSNLPDFFALLAEAHWRAGQKERGLTALADAFTQVSKSENRSCEAELYRLKGILMLQTGVPDDQPEVTEILYPRSSAPVEAEAEESFHRAIEIARQQGAKSLELRAVTNLAHLWQQQGRREEARKILAEMYSWFTEGFDTADLKDAKALLEELSE